MNVNIVKKQMKKLNKTPQDLADACDVALTSVYRWLNGSTSRISEEKLKILGKELEVSILTLKEESFDLIKPVLGTVKAGYNYFLEEDILGYEEVNVVEARKGDYFLKVTGDSMVGDGILDGDLVYVKQTNEIGNHAIGVFLIGEEVTIKRYEKKQGLIILSASNPTVPMRMFNENEVAILPVKILGQVIYAKRLFV